MDEKTIEQLAPSCPTRSAKFASIATWTAPAIARAEGTCTLMAKLPLAAEVVALLFAMLRKPATRKPFVLSGKNFGSAPQELRETMRALSWRGRLRRRKRGLPAASPAPRLQPRLVLSSFHRQP